MHFVSKSCQGELCRVGLCEAPATHKIAEDISEDYPALYRHPYTAYVCCHHFQLIMGPRACKNLEKWEEAEQFNKD